MSKRVYRVHSCAVCVCVCEYLPEIFNFWLACLYQNFFLTLHPNSVTQIQNRSSKQELQKGSESDVGWVILFAEYFPQTPLPKEPPFQWILGCVAERLLFTGNRDLIQVTFPSMWRGLFMQEKQRLTRKLNWDSLVSVLWGIVYIYEITCWFISCFIFLSFLVNLCPKYQELQSAWL